MFVAPDLAGLTFFFGPDATRILTEKALVCASCGRPEFWFVNRNGRTQCFGCDGKEASAHA